MFERTEPCVSSLVEHGAPHLTACCQLAMALCNAASSWVDEVLEGVAATSQSLVYEHGSQCRLVLRRDGEADSSLRCVALVSGGGSGHEPAHAGFVGAGMLSAAVCGDVFASPTVAAVLAAITRVGGDAGVLLVVKNYTGDRLNFGLACERARALGVRCETVLVQDDVSLPPNAVAGRRGLAGTLLVHKAAGAAAACGLPLAEVAAEARAVANDLATVNVITALAALPGGEVNQQRLPVGYAEVGGGIHGEPGSAAQPAPPLDGLVHLALKRATENEYAIIPPSSPVVLLVNGMGGSSPAELALTARSALAWLAARGYSTLRVYVGSLMTSLCARGFSLTLLRVREGEAGRTLLSRLDAPTDAPYWPRSYGSPGGAEPMRRIELEARPAPLPPPPRSARDAALEASLRAGAQALLEAEASLDAADAICGDGDCGRTLAGGARAVLADLPCYSLEEPASLFRGLAASVRGAVGGTSGVLLDILFSAAEAEASSASGDWSATVVRSLAAGVDAVQRHGGAAPGMRTMLDALCPALSAARAALEQQGNGWAALQAAAGAAVAGAAATRAMAPRAGRASYRAEGLLSADDPGATAVALVLAAAAAQAAGVARRVT